MRDAVIECFRSDFVRFWGLLEKQIDMCPESVWVEKAGGYLFWQQIFHTIGCMRIYNSFADTAIWPQEYGQDVVMLSVVPSTHMSKEAMKTLAQAVEKDAHAFMDNLTSASLTEKNEVMSRIFGKTMTNQHALMAMIRHLCYHLGCCDAVLRDRGLAGVY